MSFGNMFDKALNALNDASNFSRAAAGAVAAGVEDAAGAVAAGVEDAATWTKQEIQKGKENVEVLSAAIKKESIEIKKIAVQTALSVEKASSEAVDVVKNKALQTADLAKDAAVLLAEKATTVYENINKEFSTKVAAPVKAACDETLLNMEGSFYQGPAGELTSLIVKKNFPTETVNNEFSDELFKQWTGGLSIESTMDMYEADTGEKISRETIKALFTDPDKAKKILSEDKNIHTIYRDILNSNKPKSLIDAVKSEEWIELGKDKAFFHGSITRGNRKFVSKDGHREAVFGSDGKIDSRNQLKGTFNFFSPTDYPNAHILVDVDPYVKYGN